MTAHEPGDRALPQRRLIRRVRRLCLADERLVAALTYGSFVSGEADAHSDVEFWLFFAEVPDPRAWLDRIGPVQHVAHNEFGSHVAFFPGLIRGEFHFATAGDIESVATWPARSGPVERMIVLDRAGQLRRALAALPADPALPATAAELDRLCGRFANWLVLAHHVAARGELLRAVDALAHAQRHLLWMVRLAEKRTQHWLTPAKGAETDLPTEVTAAIHAATATADSAALAAALRAAWRSGRRCWQELADRAGFGTPTELFRELDAALGLTDG